MALQNAKKNIRVVDDAQIERVAEEGVNNLPKHTTNSILDKFVEYIDH